MITLPLAVGLAVAGLCLLLLTGLAVYQGINLGDETNQLQARHDRLTARLDTLESEPLIKVSVDEMARIRTRAAQINVLYGHPGVSPDVLLARLTEVLHQRVQVVSLSWQQKDGSLTLVVEAPSATAAGEVHALLEQEAAFSSVILARKSAAGSARGGSQYEFHLREAQP